MTELTKQEAYAELEQRVQRVYAALKDATAYADAHKLHFTFSPAYAMGGTYYGDPDVFAEVKEWNYNAEAFGAGTGWAPSSGSC